jgi:hypothetical protein
MPRTPRSVRAALPPFNSRLQLMPANEAEQLPSVRTGEQLPANWAQAQSEFERTPGAHCFTESTCALQSHLEVDRSEAVATKSRRDSQPSFRGESG